MSLINQNAANKLSEKLMEIFAASAIKTLGDLAKQQEMQGYEKLPAAIIAHTLSPDMPFSTPSGYFFLMKRAGFDFEATAKLGEAADDYKYNQLKQACLTFNPA